jgi:probable rRNA maturation factor
MRGSCLFADHEVVSGLKQKRKLSAFINNMIFSFTKKENHLQYVLCSDEYLLHINQNFLNHDNYTDIITFDLSEKNSEFIFSEIYISIDRVKENAIQHGSSFEEELLRVILHGALHLCGFKDKQKTDKELMREKENEWIAKFKG